MYMRRRLFFPGEADCSAGKSLFLALFILYEQLAEAVNACTKHCSCSLALSDLNSSADKDRTSAVFINEVLRCDIVKTSLKAVQNLCDKLAAVNA